MGQKNKLQEQPTASDIISSITFDWYKLKRHVNDLGLFLVSKKRVRILLRLSFAVLCFAILLAIRFGYDNQPIVGDQPHYMLMEYSLVHDHDFNLANNFAHHDSNTFGVYPPHGLAPGGQVGPGQVKTPSHQYSIHGIGLPLLILPGYLIGGRIGVQVEMLLVAVAVLFLVYYWSKIVTKSIKYSFIACVALFVSYLFYGLAGYVFPDMLIGAIIVSSLIILTKAPDNLAWQILLGVILGFSVLVHYKMLAFAIPVALVLCYLTWTHSRNLPYAMLVPLVVFALLLLYLTHKWFGIWNPSGVLAGVGGVGARPAALFKNVSAVLFDAARGLIANSPIVVLVFAGLPVWFRRSKTTLLITLICIAVPVAGWVVFSDWGGGDAPTGRYAMNFLPALMPAVAMSVKYLKAFWPRVFIILLFIATVAITIYLIDIKKGWLGVTSPFSSPILINTNLAFNRWFPNFNYATNVSGRLDWVKVAIDYVLLIGLMAYGYVVSRSSATKKKSH